MSETPEVITSAPVTTSDVPVALRRARTSTVPITADSVPSGPPGGPDESPVSRDVPALSEVPGTVPGDMPGDTPGRIRTALAAGLRTATPTAWGVLVAVVVTGVLGLMFGWIELLVLAGCALAVLITCTLFLLGRTDYDVALDVAATRVVAGQPASGQLTVSNTAARPHRAGSILLPVGDRVVAVPVPRLGSRLSATLDFPIPTEKRGVIPVGPASSVRGDPMALFHRDIEWPATGEVIVHPVTVPVSASASGFFRDLDGPPTRDVTSSDIAFQSLREYVPGDDLRSVHWRTTARLGTLMVRQFEQTHRSHQVIVLSDREDDYTDPAEFELAVSIVGSLGVRAIMDQRELTVLFGAHELSAASRNRLLDALAVVELSGADGAGWSRVALDLSVRAPAASIVTLVAGSSPAPPRWLAGARQVPIDVHAIGIAANPGHELRRRVYGPLPVVSVARLDALSDAVRVVTQ